MRAFRFRRRGLRGTAADLVEMLGSPGGQSLSLLEVGGGLGEIQVTLLETGSVVEVTNIELSSSWEERGRQLLRERGLEERVNRLVGDFVDEADGIDEADLVVLHRVLCCYPYWERMLDAAATRARRRLGFTVPVDRWWTHTAIRAVNLLLCVRRMSFRVYVHPPEAMIRRLESADFSMVGDHAGIVWRTMVFEREVDGASGR